MRPTTQCGRMLGALAQAWPCWIGGYRDGREHGFSWHTASQRCGELTHKHGFPVVSRRREGEVFYEYRLKDGATYERARLQVKAWATGIDVATLEAQESLRPMYQPGLFTRGGA